MRARIVLNLLFLAFLTLSCQQSSTPPAAPELNQPPDAPQALRPISGADPVSINTRLAWTGSDPGGETLIYDLYFGAGDNPTLACSALSATEYDPGPLAQNTTYRWRVTARDPLGQTTTGPLWSFTTGEPTVLINGPAMGTWDFDHSPYLVQGDLLVPAGETLTLEAGVEVIFQGWHSLTMMGSLQALGQVGDSVTFTAADQAAGWEGLRFISGSSRLNYGIVEYGRGEPWSYYGTGGGGVYCGYGASVTLEHCSIRYNTAVTGGGVHALVGEAVLRYCEIRDNRAEGYSSFYLEAIGGGALGGHLYDCVIKNNTTDYGGGLAGGVAERCLITANQAEQGGGVGAYSFDSSVLRLDGCTISRNQAAIGGGLYGCLPMRNCIVEGNQGGGLFYSYDDMTDPEEPEWNPVIRHCDFASNEGYDISAHWPSVLPWGLGAIEYENTNGTACDVYGNLFLNPLFVNPEAGDFHLQEWSFCIDAGDPDGPLDPDWTPADMGAFYYPQ